MNAFSPVAQQAALARLRAGDRTPASPGDARPFDQRSVPAALVEQLEQSPRVEGAYPEKDIPAPPRRRAVNGGKHG